MALAVLYIRAPVADEMHSLNTAKTADSLRDVSDGNRAHIWQIQYAHVNPAV